MTKERFSERLRWHVNAVRGNDARPFICLGHPFEADIFVVGVNAKTDVNMPFWSFWKTETGMNLAKFDKRYLSQTVTHKFSDTRKNINSIANNLSPGLRWLATNIYWHPSKDQALLSEHQTGNPHLRTKSPFRWLMGACNPEYIIAHGSKAHTEVERLNSGGLLGNATVIKCDHLGSISPTNLQKQVFDKLP
jgi:hypothetical protein